MKKIFHLFVELVLVSLLSFLGGYLYGTGFWQKLMQHPWWIVAGVVGVFLVCCLLAAIEAIFDCWYDARKPKSTPESDSMPESDSTDSD